MTLLNFNAFLAALEDFSSYYTRDSYRAPVLNTFDRCIEIQKVHGEIQDGHLREGALSWMIEELKHSVQQDKIIKKYYSTEAEEFTVLVNSADLEKRMFAIDRLFSAIKHQYFRKCRMAIQECVCSDEIESHKLGDLVALTGTFYSRLINAGHTQEEVFRQVAAFRRRAGSETSSKRALQDFFSCFPCRSRVFTAYVSANTNLVAGLGNAAFVDITKKVPSKIYRRHKADLNLQKDNYSVFCISDFEAFDHSDARQRIDAQLKLARALSYTQRYDVEANWGENIVIEDTNTEVSIAIASPLSPMRSRRRISKIHSEKVAAVRAEKLSNSDYGDEVKAALENSIMEYANAFQSSSPATQLVSVWSALEGLAPRLAGEEGGRISEVSKVVCTAQELYYPRNLMQWNFTNHYSIDGDSFTKIIDSFSTSRDRLYNFAKMIINNEDAELSRKLKDLSAERPMTQFRCFQALQKMESGAAIQKTILEHTQRVDWQIRRIYLERNRIVHRASPSRNVSALLLNLCEYYLNTLEMFFEFLEVIPPGRPILYCYFEAAQSLKRRAAEIKNWKSRSEIDVDCLVGRR